MKTGLDEKLERFDAKVVQALLAGNAVMWLLKLIKPSDMKVSEPTARLVRMCLVIEARRMLEA